MSIPDFGQCYEADCGQTSVRLFDCAHHCMKRVCLQHLIEHDQLIECNDDHLRTELLQLWSNYSSLVDETKLRLEFEQKSYKYRQFIREISSLFELNSADMDQYRFMIEKLKQHIEEEKQQQTNPYSIESYPTIEQVKIEPSDIISSTDDLDSLNVSLATQIEKLNTGIAQQQKRQSNSNNPPSITEEMITTNDNNTSITPRLIANASIRRLSAECPLWFDGAYGLTEKTHGMYICPRKRHKELYRHIIRFHKLTVSSAEKICRAILNDESPINRNLFQSDEIVVDQINHIFCPFSIYNPHPSKILQSNERSCRCTKPQSPHVLSYHFIRDHRMSLNAAKRLAKKFHPSHVL